MLKKSPNIALQFQIKIKQVDRTELCDIKNKFKITVTTKPEETYSTCID